MSEKDLLVSYRGCKEISFFEVLKHIRSEKGISIDMLADLTGWSSSKVGRFEKTSLPKHRDDVDELAEALGCNGVRKAQLRKAYLCHILRRYGIL